MFPAAELTNFRVLWSGIDMMVAPAMVVAPLRDPVLCVRRSTISKIIKTADCRSSAQPPPFWGRRQWYAIHVCATGAVATCAPRRCALGQARLAVWFVGPRRSGAAKTAGGAPLLAAARWRLGGQEGRRRTASGFYPPWLLFVQT
jgi:hypothetical protein